VDIKKLFLYAALGVVCLSIYTAWQKDYGYDAKMAAAKTSNAENLSVAENASSTHPSSLSNNETAATAKNRTITVQTDVLDVSIDTLGGNVISAKLRQYPLNNKEKNTPIQILNNDSENLYIAQSDLSGLNNNQPLSYKTTKKNYTLASADKTLEVNLTWQNNKGTTVTKTFKFTQNSYAIDVDYKIKNAAKNDLNAQIYTQFKRKQPQKSGGFFTLQTFDGAAISSEDKPYEKINYNKMDKNNLSRDIQDGWVAMQQRYFLSAWVPEQNVNYHYYSSAADKVYTIGMIAPITVAANTQKDINTKLYVGPEIENNLTAIHKTLKLTIDYGWLWIVSASIFWVMQQIFNLIGNWGVAIILVTVLIKLLFWKLSASAYRSSAKMRLLTPKMQALKERYSDDRQKLSMATMELYKKEKINPAGGCLPMLIQIPIFIALYYVLVEAVQLRQAPFTLWINDLASKDPYYVLPVLMGISMFLQQKLNPPPPDPAQAKMFMLMPIIFTGLFASFPSGLVLYWFTNNLISALQQWHIIRKYEQSHKKK
jgi:YidC/Oxa1 family membrane protein insertase